MIYSKYCLIKTALFVVHMLCLDGFFHISWSQAHSSVKFSSVFSFFWFQKLFCQVFSFGFKNSFFSPRLFLPVKQSLKNKGKNSRQRPPCGYSPPPQCVAPSCLRPPPARKPPSPPWPSAQPTCCRSTCKTSQCPSNSAAASPSGQPSGDPGHKRPWRH